MLINLDLVIYVTESVVLDKEHANCVYSKEFYRSMDKSTIIVTDNSNRLYNELLPRIWQLQNEVCEQPQTLQCHAPCCMPKDLRKQFGNFFKVLEH